MSTFGKNKAYSNLIKDLEGAVRGQVLHDSLTLLAYASDSSIFRQVPAVVVHPLDGEDVAATVKVGTRHQVPITARGAGTSRAGQDLGPGIILDMSVHMDAILSVDPEGQSVLVEPGVVAAHLEAALSQVGLFFPPDPSSNRICTIGGMVANNASGARTVKFGATRDYVQALQVVLWDGSLVEVGPVHLGGGRVPGSGAGSGSAGATFPGEGWEGLPRALHSVARLVADRQGVIRDQYAWHLGKNSSGYNFKGIPFVDRGVGVGVGAREQAGAKVGANTGADAGRQAGSILQPPVTWNPAGLFVGSEGTLGIITQIRLRLLKRPKESASLMVFLDSLPQVANTVQALIPYGPSKLEILDRELLMKASQAVQGLELFLEHRFNFLLMVEVWEESRDQVFAVLEQMEGGVLSGVGKIRLVEPEEEQRIWTIRSKSVGYLNRMKGRQRAYPLLEDGSVGVAGLVEYLHGLGQIWEELEIGGLHYHGHAGDGNIHVNTMLDLSRPQDVEKGRRLLQMGHRLIRSLDGVLSGEHGDGRLRTPFLAEAAGDLHSLVHIPLKKILDPAGILNPGQIVTREEMGLAPFVPFGAPVSRGTGRGGGMDGADEAGRAGGAGGGAEESISEVSRELEARGVLVNLRYGVDYPVVMAGGRGEARHVSSLVPCFDVDGVKEVESCHGCGECRDYCPVSRGLGVEIASPRNRADMVRELLSSAALATGGEDRFPHHIDQDLLSVNHREFSALMDLCLGCMGCLHDCPSGVDIPSIARAARSARLKGRPPTFRERFYHNLPTLIRLGAQAGGATNRLLASSLFRKLLEGVFHLDHRAHLPRLGKIKFGGGEEGARIEEGGKTGGLTLSFGGKAPREPVPFDGVVFFPGCQGQYLVDGGGKAAFSALTRAVAPLPVVVPRLPCCGMPTWNQGLNPSRSARQVVRELESLVASNRVVVFGCPSCRYMVVNHYPKLLGEEALWFLEGRQYDVHQFLSLAAHGHFGHLAGALQGVDGGPSLERPTEGAEGRKMIRVAHHVPCHGRGAGVAEGVAATVGKLPWVQLVELPRGCCGGGGGGGVVPLKKETVELARAVGRDRVEALEKIGGAKMIISSCMTCRSQLARMTGLPVFHPLDLLNLEGWEGSRENN